MKYCVWTESDITGIERFSPVCRVVTEVTGDGAVLREIGMAADGRVVYARDDGRGIFDGVAIDFEGLRNEISAAEFVELWRLGKSTP